jgi:flagellar basal body L-ring protein FlgH
MVIVAGCRPEVISREPEGIFSQNAILFLEALSKELFKDKRNRNYPDIISFAYWCRRSNLNSIAKNFRDERRIGRGVAFHVAPTNVPINFAFSLAFGLLSGNSNIVRVSEKVHEQSQIVGTAINIVLNEAEHSNMKHRIALVRYPRDSSNSTIFSSTADARIFWGGDQTITEMRGMVAPARCVDVCFADRYSFCTIVAAAVEMADDGALDQLVNGFYNDVYLFDQNACSSPHLVVWQGAEDSVHRARKKFWDRLSSLIQSRYEFQPIQAVDKLALLCRAAIEIDGAQVLPATNNLLRRVVLKDVPENIDQFRGQYGLFYEIMANDLSWLKHIVNDRYQTLTYFGVDPKELASRVMSLRLRGIDRIVPVGQALDIGIIWDGYDVVDMLSRIVDWH